MKPIVYLDNAATTKMLPEVIEVITKQMEQTYANASSTYSIGRKAKSDIELVRKNIAKHLGVSSAEIIFTSGGTEANNWILQTAVKDLGVKRIITSKIEHHAVLKTIEKLAVDYNIKVDYVSFTEEGDISIESIKILLAKDAGKTLVSLMHINNEIGTILDIKEVGMICESNEALFHTDTVQSIGHFSLNLKNSKVHFATASAHKFNGPKGIGFVFAKRGLKIRAMQYGGEQERGLRAGTESVPLIIGMEKALEVNLQNLDINYNYILGLKNFAINQFLKLIPDIVFNAHSNKASRNYNLLNIRLPISNEKAATTLFHLDLAGICCSRGSACQSGSNRPSHVLAVICPKKGLEFTSLRLSFSIYNTKIEINYLIERLIEVIGL